MNLRSSWSISFKAARRWLAASLAIALVMSSLTGVAHATSTETVTGIEFYYQPSDYNPGTSSLEMVVEDDKVNLTVYATISGQANKKDVTSEAVWKSSNSAIVKVEKGVLSGVGGGSATISATYKGYSASIKATSEFEYDEVTLLQNGATAPAEITDVKLGDSLTFSLEGKKGSSTTETITAGAVWTSSNTSVATVSEGKLTLIGAGSVTITAKYKGKSDSIKLTVTSPYKSISIGHNGTGDLLELEMGTDPTTLKATVEPKTGGTQIVTETAKWTSGNTKVVTVDKGVLTAVGIGKTTITVSHLGVTDSITVVVRTPYQSIKLSPEKEYHMQIQDAPLQIKAEVQTNTNETNDITAVGEWFSSDVSVATVDKGKVTPKAVGTTKISVTHKGISRSIDVTVYPSVFKLKIDKTVIDGFKGISGDLPKVTATLFDGSTIDVSKLAKWTVADSTVAEIADGKWTANKLGQTVLSVAVQDLKAEAKLIVHTKPVKLIADNKDISIVIGKPTSLPKVSVIYEDGEEADISESIEWKTTSDSIILLETTMKGLEEASLTLTGTYLTKTVTVKIKVEEEIVKLVAEPTKIELNPGRSKSIKVTGYYKSGKKVSVGSKMNWETSNTAVAAVSGTASVKAINVGATKVSGVYQGHTVDIPVIVTPKLKSLIASTKSVQLAVGTTTTLSIQADYYTGSPVNVTASAVWTSSKTSVAKVEDGKITAVGKGSASIKATFGGKSVTIRVTVK
ncbi:Ig domain-containing protein [Paenibacillus sp. GCM10027627]|uniref:Ig-like domain-containing protein n=1 Tax=unclassified Paenibacillus TaxID=185978 RepID=UPI003636D0DC